MLTYNANTHILNTSTNKTGTKKMKNAEYRKIGQSLYKFDGRDFMHVCIVPPHIKTLAAAVKYYDSL